MEWDVSHMHKRVLLDSNGEDLAVSYVQDVEPIIENNRQWQGEAQRGDFRLKASIPEVTLMTWLNEEWGKGNRGLRWGSAEFMELVQRKLADPDNRDLLTRSKHAAYRRGWTG